MKWQSCIDSLSGQTKSPSSFKRFRKLLVSKIFDFDINAAAKNVSSILDIEDRVIGNDRMRKIDEPIDEEKYPIQVVDVERAFNPDRMKLMHGTMTVENKKIS